MMRQLAFVWGILGVIGLQAQARVEFEKAVHDFGQVKEEVGSIEYSFIFTNNGTAPLIISSVKTSCGCTTPFWTREPIEPGTAGKITARYNTMNRPGAFNKSLTVVSNAGTLTLIIKGTVIPRIKTVEDELPAKIGALRILHKTINFGKITTEKVISKDFDIYNDSDSAFSFIPSETIVPEHVTISFDPLELKSKQKGVLRITYDPIKRKALGYQTDQVVLKTTESKEAEKMLFLVTTIEEYFPPMSEEERAKAPKLTINKTTHDFGKITAGAVVETTFLLTNSGKGELNIRGTMGNCACAVGTLDRDTLQPGESAKMKVTFDSKSLKGRQYKNVTIFSNDPASPTQMVNLKADM